jgi:putative ABC transport system permease protein
MFDLDRWIEIFETIRKNKLRTVLSGFTIAFAILLFTLLFGVGNGLLHTFEREFARNSMLSIYIYGGKTTKPYKGLQSGRRIRLKNDDLSYLTKNYEDKMLGISPTMTRQLQGVYKGKQNSYSVRAVYPSYQVLQSAEIESGRYINTRDVHNRSKVICIGRLVEKDLFGERSGLGKDIFLGGISYKIIGTFSDIGGDREERVIYTPFTGFQKIYGNSDNVEGFGLTYNPKMSVDEAIAFGNTLERDLKEKHNVAPNDQRAIRVQNYTEGNRQVSSMMFGLNIGILIIGIGTLLAGVIGISNIMVYIVKERTVELGVRKALGATPKSIIGMIMLESIFITTISGYVGLLVGTTVLRMIGDGLEKYFIVNPSVENYVVVGATIVLILAGTIAGFIPAQRAARIKPIDALRGD